MIACACEWNGWPACQIDNGMLRLTAVPSIGGRLMELALHGRNLLYVNPAHLGKTHPRARNVGGFADWKNYGGSVTWLAPQGWDRPDQWHGPPDRDQDTVIDSGLWTGEARLEGKEAVLLLEGPEDQALGIQISKTFRIGAGTGHVSVNWQIRNPRREGVSRWSIWENSALHAATSTGSPEDRLEVIIPRNPDSRFAKGFHVMFGSPANSQWMGVDGALHRVRYAYEVGKAAWDCRTGWAMVDHPSRDLSLLRRFPFDPQADYPDGGCNFALWTNGRGSFEAAGQQFDCPEDPSVNAPVLELETMSPFTELAPGQTAFFEEEWLLTPSVRREAK